MNTQPGSRIYFLDNFADDGAPCAPTLEGWAQWLAQPGDDRRTPPRDGDTFGGMALLFDDDIEMTFANREWRFSREPEPGRFLAVRHGPGLGWSEEDIIAGGGDQGGLEALRAWTAEVEVEGHDWTEHVACAVIENDWRFTFRAGPPPQLEAERGQ